IEGEDQVTLKVTIAEVRREVLKQLGFDNLVSSSSGLTVFGKERHRAIAAGAGCGLGSGSRLAALHEALRPIGRLRGMLRRAHGAG
ncbi:hypothetical protein ACC730_37780, partial [Rhizobium ruizarguesonis]